MHSQYTYHSVNHTTLAHLESLYFDKLFEPIDDEEILLVIVIRDIARPQPLAVERFRVSRVVLVVTLHDLGSSDEDLAALVRPAELTFRVHKLKRRLVVSNLNFAFTSLGILEL